MKILIIVVLVFFTINLNGQDSPGYISPKPTGTWNVGRKLVEWVDSSRIDIIDSTQYRTIPVFIWYPAIVNETIIPQYPLDEDWRNEQGKYLNKKIGVGASQFLQNLKVWSLTNAPAVSVKDKFPVLIFGPGYTWLTTDYSILIEEIVSHGYIVVGYIPTGFPGVTKLANRKIINGSLTVHQQDIIFEDAMFVLKNLSRLENGWLKEIIDINQVGAFGHSQGGIAATVLAGNNSAIKAFVNLDGDLMGDALKIKVTQPGLLLNNDERVAMTAATEKMDREGRERSEYRRHSDWVRATDDAQVSLRIRINGIRHLNFNDLGIVPMDLMSPAERKDKLGIVDGEKSLKIISEITRQFFDAYLKNSSFFTLVHLEEKYPEVQGLLWKGIPYY
ncbi:MAG: hypothetical protein EHM47_09910 [Ignavibacteriales bacterium]|nr:MAG: hypothetical protein EHM47_09910 [Ignavibacteriales bacterium]